MAAEIMSSKRSLPTKKMILTSLNLWSKIDTYSDQIKQNCLEKVNAKVLHSGDSSPRECRLFYMTVFTNINRALVNAVCVNIRHAAHIHFKLRAFYSCQALGWEVVNNPFNVFSTTQQEIKLLGSLNKQLHKIHLMVTNS